LGLDDANYFFTRNFNSDVAAALLGGKLSNHIDLMENASPANPLDSLSFSDSWKIARFLAILVAVWLLLHPILLLGVLVASICVVPPFARLASPASSENQS
jgi:hypothetical protein